MLERNAYITGPGESQVSHWCRNVTDKEGEAVGTIRVVMDQSWRRQYEFMFSFIYIQLAMSRNFFLFEI